MNKFLSKLYIFLSAFFLMACESDEVAAMPPTGNTNPPEVDGKTLIVYYSYTNNTEQIVNDLMTLINVDVIEVEPVDKNLDYAANNYAIGTEQLNKIKSNPNDENSYPAIDPVEIDMSKYSTIIIATPLWWSQMASNMQTFLFKYGTEMADKNIGLVVSSHSSSISGVEADAKRLVPDGRFFTKSLWINASKHSQRKSLLEQWLKDIGYNQKQNANTMTLTVNKKLQVNLAENVATEALLARLKEGAITYSANDYGGFEKVGSLGFSLPTCDTYITTQPGDIMLYTGNQLCIFFDSNSWQYTRIGKIEGLTAQQLREELGQGEVSITLSLDDAAGIVSATANMTKNIYASNGQKLAEVPTKGIYIEDGVKKVQK